MARIERNLATCDFTLLSGLYFNTDTDGARFMFENRKFELQINAQIQCWPNFEVTIGPNDKRRKIALKAQSRFVMTQCEWTREALTTALMLDHSEELKKYGITYALDANTIELPEGII